MSAPNNFAAMHYNDKVDFVNAASRQLEAKLAAENDKFHQMLMQDAQRKMDQMGAAQQQNGHHHQQQQQQQHLRNPPPEQSNVNHNSFQQRQPAEYAHDYFESEEKGFGKKMGTSSTKYENFEGPITREIAPAHGSIGATVTEWKWTKQAERKSA